MKPVKILSVDDSPENLRYVGTLLKRHIPDIALLETTKSVEALHMAEKDQPDLILLDAKMPELNGFEACKRLKVSPQTSHIPILMISGAMVEKEHKVFGLESGADGYICKPFEPEEFIAQVKALLRMKSSQDALRAEQEKTRRVLAERTKNLKESERRLEYLNTVLYAIRSVDQVVFKEKEPAHILKQVCEKLVKTGGFHSAWIVVFGKEGDLQFTAESGLDSDFIPIIEQLKKPELTPCWREALQTDKVIVHNPKECVDCSLKCTYGNRSAMIVRLSYAGRIQGLLAVSVLNLFADQSELLALLRSVASNLSVSLSSIEAETNRRAAEAALRQSEMKYRSLIENMRDIPFSLDPTGTLLYIGPQVQRYGYRPEEMVGRYFAEFLSPHDRERVARELSLTIATGTEFPTSFRIIGKDKIAYWLEENGSVQRNEDGEIIAVSGILRDITERVEAEEERTKLQSQLIQSQKMESIGHLAGGVAHDFNNILTGMMGYTQLLLDQQDEGSPQYTDLSEIYKLSQQAANLTQQLLAFSRRQALKPTIVNLNTLVNDMLKMLSRLIGENIQLQFDADKELPSIRADQGQMQQVIMNMAVNARDAMPKGGNLTISTRSMRLETDRPGLEELQPGDYVLLSVSDTGAGIDADVLARVFEPFFTTKTKGKGTGLGLSTVYGIVKQHGGVVQVDSKPGSGTTFYVYLPVCTEGELGEEKGTHDAVSRGEGHNIMLVEDDDSVQQLTKRVLERQGYKVFAMSSAEEAMEFLRRSPKQMDLLITDIVLPYGSGYQLYESVAQTLPGLPVLYISGYNTEREIPQYIAKDDSAFLQKPFSPEEILMRVTKKLRATA